MALLDVTNVLTVTSPNNTAHVKSWETRATNVQYTYIYQILPLVKAVVIGQKIILAASVNTSKN